MIREVIHKPSYQKHIDEILYDSNIPFPTNTIPQEQFIENLFCSSITNIPLFEDTNVGIRMKLIYWDPFTKSHLHNHNGEDCWFRALYPNMIQVITGSNICEETTSVPHNKFDFMNDDIGKYKMANTSIVNVNLTFHLYIHTNNKKIGRYQYIKPDLKWYGVRNHSSYKRIKNI